MPTQAAQTKTEATPKQTENTRSVTDRLSLAVPPREILIPLVVLAAVLMLMSAPAIAASVNTGVGSNSSATDLRDTLQDIGNFISLIVIGVAVPNGAYGFLQYMTAGSNVEQDEKGRERIRNTFIGLAGVAVIQGAVAIFNSTLDISVS